MSEKEIKLVVDSVSGLETSLSYIIEFTGKLAGNAMFPNALSVKKIGLQADAQLVVEIPKVSAEMIQQIRDKGRINLRLKFAQRVDLENLKMLSHHIQIKYVSLIYSLIYHANVSLDDADMTGQKILIQDVEKAFTLKIGTEGEGFKSQSKRSYQLNIAQETIKTENGEKSNQEKLRTHFKGISISAAELEKIMLTSAHEIIVVFKEEIEAEHLQAHHVKVMGYER